MTGKSPARTERDEFIDWLSQLRTADGRLVFHGHLLDDVGVIVDALRARVRAESIETWQERIAVLWPFLPSTYPALQPGRHAAIRHVILHQVKDVGRLATEIERVDHAYQPFDTVIARRAARNTLVNALRLCDLLDCSPKALLEDYEKEMIAREDDRHP